VWARLRAWRMPWLLTHDHSGALVCGKPCVRELLDERIASFCAFGAVTRFARVDHGTQFRREQRSIHVHPALLGYGLRTESLPPRGVVKIAAGASRNSDDNGTPKRRDE